MAKKSERTRQRIIDAANRLFYQQGYHNTSFTDVVDATNIPRGNIYYYFKTKDEILVAAIRHRTERISAMLDDWSGKYRTPIERLHRFVNILEDSADSLTRFGCPMGSLNIELGKNDPTLQEEAENLFKVFEAWLAEQFDELGFAGRSHELALRVIAMGQGISVVSHVHRDAGFLRRERDRMLSMINQLVDGEESCL